MQQYLLTSDNAKRLLQGGAGSAVTISLDLNLSTAEVQILPDGIRLPDGRVVNHDELQAMARKRRRVFALTPDGPEPLEITGEHYYKLTPTSGAPTIEINGVQMHRTKDIDPFDDSRLKVLGTVREGDTVLDTCGGLGYTAIWSARMGAARVISVEVCPEVRQLRAINPWSRELYDPPIELVDGDIFKYIRALPDSSFDSIVHDPPRFSLAGELYGAEFYAELLRVLRGGGRLFHYTGAPHSRRGLRDFPAEVARRLTDVGFRVKYEPQKFGVSARK